ncbi:hypothetical protein CIHG_09899 [Coccidioides immitis H538.4]|uniref:Uncharacterized protein n=1 Tax=Coccidioides immitis H538.4 TaxID=396776 RepID=A0A0J8S5E1_COCIT|nr:hypothetical protein CIHG_09899 [Coccidioides immitis H538.4]
MHHLPTKNNLLSASPNRLSFISTGLPGTVSSLRLPIAHPYHFHPFEGSTSPDPSRLFPFVPPSSVPVRRTKFGLTTTCCGIGVLPQNTTTERFLHRPRSRIISVAFLPCPPSDPVCIRPPLGANSSPSIPQDPRSYPKFYFNY